MPRVIEAPSNSPLSARLLALLPALVLCGCSALPGWNARLPGNKAIITPLRCAEEKGKLRLAIKDNIDVEGVVTSVGSRYLAENRPPAAKDAACLAIARERGVQIIGKTNCTEFTVSPSGMNDYFGTPRNPFCFWTKRIPGGSSSGSAVAVAGDMADVAFGTDTAGSVRVPAACCGVVGLKTTLGLVPIEGVFPVESHLDTVGPMGKDIASTVVGMDLLERGFLGQYSAAKAAKPTPAQIRVGRLRLKGTDPKIDEAIDAALAKTGFQVVQLDASLSERWEQAKADGNAMAASGAWISDQKYRFTPGVSARTKVIILTGRINYATKYQGALARRGDWQATLAETFKKVDFIAIPTLQRSPLTIPSSPDFGLLEAETLAAQNTSPLNYAGNPALALPVPLHGSGFAMASLQLIGPNKSEPGLLNAGRLVEAAVHPTHRGSSYDRLATACPSSGGGEALR